jgi:cell division protein FtsB
MHQDWKKLGTKYFVIALVAVFLSYLVINGVIVFIQDTKAIALAKQSFALITGLAGMGAKVLWDIVKKEYAKNKQRDERIEELIKKDSQQQTLLTEQESRITNLEIEINKHVAKEFGHIGSQDGIQRLEKKLIYLEAQVENYAGKLENLLENRN